MTSWATFLKRFAALGLTGFGGPPAHLTQLQRTWVASGEVPLEEFQDALAATTLLPGPTSTQMSMWVGWHTKGVAGASAAALLFITPAVLLVTALAMVLHTNSHWGPWILKGATGASWMMPGVVLVAGWSLIKEPLKPTSWRLSPEQRIFYVNLLLSIVAEQLPYFNPILVLLLAGGWMVLRDPDRRASGAFALAGFSGVTTSLATLALKIGLLSVGGGFVIVPMMHADAVTNHHWVTDQIFVVLVALGQLTPGPVFSTVAAIGYYADGLRGAAIAAILAFLPSYLMIILAAPKLQKLRSRRDVTLFFSGALPASIGLILGTAPVFAWAIHQWVGALVAVVGGVALFSKKVPLPFVLLCGVALGLVLAHP